MSNVKDHMKTAKWVMFAFGCGAVLLVVLLAGCVRKPHHRAVYSVPSSANPQSVVLAWDASPSPDVTHYRIHFGTNGVNYSFVTNVGLVLKQTVILPHRDRWFFAITAVDSNGIESPCSDQAQLEYQSYALP